jgi:hypothetical protein
VKAIRWPALVLIVALLAVALLLGGDDGAATDGPADTATPVPKGAVVAKPDALSALWFCNGGTAADNGIGDHRVTIVNTTGEPRSGTITAYASRPANGPRRAPVERSWELAPRTRTEVRLAELTGAAPFASATVEVTGGGVLVEHSVSGSLGTDRAACSSSASSTWFVPVGVTGTITDNPAARELLVFFNPFPGDAVLDVSFSTETGFRGTPDAFKGLVVPGGSVVGVDVAAAGVAVSTQVAAAVTTRTGRIVVDRLQVFNDGQNRRGLGLSSGVAGAAQAWVFPAGRLGGGRQERVVVFNPGSGPAEVDIEVRPEDTALVVEPFQLTVRPGQHSQLDLHAESRLAGLVSSGAPYTLVVRSADDSLIVAERLVTVGPGSTGPGTGVSSGSAVAGTRWFADVADADLAGSAIVVMNPSAKSVSRVRVTVLARGTATVPPKYQEIELQPGARLTVPASELSTGAFTVALDATSGVVVERELVGTSDRAVAIGAVDSASVVPLDLGGLLSLGS